MKRIIRLLFRSKSTLVILYFIAFSNISEAKHLVFNLTGTFHGFGDITGPMWTIAEMKRLNPDNEVSVIVDPRAIERMGQVFVGSSLGELEDRFGIKFVTLEEARNLKKSDYSFEMNFGARKIHHLTNLVYNDDHTVTIISNTMHDNAYDEVRFDSEKGESHLYFKPPGIGPNRSGIFDDPNLKLFQDKTLEQRRETAVNLFKDTLVGTFLNDPKNRDIKIGFLYGAHNEVINPELIGQTKKFIAKLKQENPDKTILIFTPNTKEHLAQSLPGNTILVPNDLEKMDHLKNGVHVVSLGYMSSQKFMGLMAISDVPVLIEGNSSVCSALRLKIPFLMYRSMWNEPQLKDVSALEQQQCGTKNFEEVYEFSKKTLPYFDKFNMSPEHQSGFYLALSKGVAADLPKKMMFIVDFVDQLRKVETSQMTPEEREKQVLRLALATEGDEVLEYSLIDDAKTRGTISKEARTQMRKVLETGGFNYRTIEKGFIPNKPHYSEKIEALERNILSNDEWYIGKLRQQAIRDISEDEAVQDYLKRHKVYISLTTSPTRISKLHHVLDTLDLTHIEKILICLPEVFGRDHSKYEIPDWLKRYPRVKILRISKDLGPITKLLPAVDYVKNKDADSTIITVDDDIGYPKGMVNEVIYQTVHNHHAVMSTTRENPPHKTEDGVGLPPFPGYARQISTDGAEGVHDVDIVAGWGTIGYLAGSVDVELMKALVDYDRKWCRVSDDLVISFALAINGVPTKNYRSRYFNEDMLHPFEYGFGDDALHKGAGIDTQGLKNSSYANNGKYLECYKKLVEVSYDSENQKYRTRDQILEQLKEK